MHACNHYFGMGHAIGPSLIFPCCFVKARVREGWKIHSQLLLRRWQQRSVSKRSRSRWFSVEGSRAVPVISVFTT